jgi:hypothetical protein
MTLEEASEILIQIESEKWDYITVINKEVDELTVVDQDPEPGTLIGLGDTRLKLIGDVYSFTPSPRPPGVDKGGCQSSDPCGGITYASIYQANVVYWCENNTLWYSDSSACGRACARHDSIGFSCTCS